MLPLLPLIVLFDGIVSCLRTYSPDELVASLDAPSYTWEIGTESVRGAPVSLTYLIGYRALA